MSCAARLFVSWMTSRMGRTKCGPIASGPESTTRWMPGRKSATRSASEPTTSTHASVTTESGSLNRRASADTTRGRCGRKNSPCVTAMVSSRRRTSCGVGDGARGKRGAPGQAVGRTLKDGCVDWKPSGVPMDGTGGDGGVPFARPLGAAAASSQRHPMTTGMCSGVSWRSGGSARQRRGWCPCPRAESTLQHPLQAASRDARGGLMERHRVIFSPPATVPRTFGL